MYFWVYKCRGKVKKKKKKKAKSRGKKKKPLLFFAGIASRRPDNPTCWKTGSKSVDLRPGHPLFAAGMLPRVPQDLLPPGGGKKLAQCARYSLYLKTVLAVDTKYIYLWFLVLPRIVLRQVEPVQLVFSCQLAWRVFLAPKHMRI